MLRFPLFCPMITGIPLRSVTFLRVSTRALSFFPSTEEYVFYISFSFYVCLLARVYYDLVRTRIQHRSIGAVCYSNGGKGEIKEDTPAAVHDLTAWLNQTTVSSAPRSERVLCLRRSPSIRVA